MDATTAIIVGAGVGGLSAAVALERAGVEVVLCERTPELLPPEYGLIVQSNAMAALRTLGMGLDEQLLRAGGQVTTLSVRAPDGSLLRRLDLAKVDEDLGAPSVALASSDFYDVMLHAAGTALNVDRGAEAVRFENSDDGVVLQLADGRHLWADVLLGADGIDSTIRAQLHGVNDPRPGGFVRWLALAPFRHPCLAEGESVHYWGHGMRFGAHDIGHGRTHWWAAMSTDPDLAANWPYDRHDLLRRFRGWAPEIGEMITATMESEILTRPAQDRQPLPRWGRGRVTLLGDAAHPMLPSLGQGANSAIEDAVVLGHALAGGLTGVGEAAAALRAYEQRRLRRTAGLVDSSRSRSRIEQATSRSVTTARDRYVRHASEAQLVASLTKSMTWPGCGDERRSRPVPRPLSALERWHWAADRVAPLHVAARARITGRVDVFAVRDALEALARRHPMLRAEIRSGRGGRTRFVPTPLRRIQLRIVDGGSWLTEIDQELCERFEPNAPLLRATLVTVEPDVHDFILTSTAVIADSVTIVSLTRQVLELAVGGVPEWDPESPAPSCPEELVPQTFRGLRGTARGLARVAHNAIRDSRTSPVRLAAEARVPAAARMTRVAHRAIGGTEYLALLAECRRQHLVPQAVIGAALTAAAAVDAGAVEANFAIGVSVPFREHLDEPVDGDAVGSFQATLPIPASYRQGQSLWHVAQSFDTELRRGIRHGHHLTGLATLGPLTPRSPAGADRIVRLLDARCPGNMCTAHLDVSEFPTHIGGWAVSGVQFVSGMSISGYVKLAASTGPEELALNLSYVDRALSPRRAEALIENVAAALLKAAAEVLATLDEA